MTKKKNQWQKGAVATKRSMGPGWYKILADYRWGRITKKEFKRLRRERMAVRKKVGT